MTQLALLREAALCAWDGWWWAGAGPRQALSTGQSTRVKSEFNGIIPTSGFSWLSILAHVLKHLRIVLFTR